MWDEELTNDYIAYPVGDPPHEWNGEQRWGGMMFFCPDCASGFHHTFLELWMLENGIIGGHQCPT